VPVGACIVNKVSPLKLLHRSSPVTNAHLSYTTVPSIITINKHQHTGNIGMCVLLILLRTAEAHKNKTCKNSAACDPAKEATVRLFETGSNYKKQVN